MLNFLESTILMDLFLILVKGGTFIFSKLLSYIASSNLIDLFLIGGNMTLDLDGEMSIDLVTSSLASSM